MKSVKWICDLCHQEREYCAHITAFGPPAEGSENPNTTVLKRRLAPPLPKRRSTDSPLKVLLELDICTSCLPVALKEVLNRVRWKGKPWAKIEILERGL